MKTVKFELQSAMETPFGGACLDFFQMPSCGFLCGNLEFSCKLNPLYISYDYLFKCWYFFIFLLFTNSNCLTDWLIEIRMNIDGLGYFKIVKFKIIYLFRQGLPDTSQMPQVWNFISIQMNQWDHLDSLFHLNKCMTADHVMNAIRRFRHQIICTAKFQYYITDCFNIPFLFNFISHAHTIFFQKLNQLDFFIIQFDFWKSLIYYCWF